MNARVSLTARKLKWLAPLLALVLLGGVALASENYAIPEEHPGPPIYARLLSWVGYEPTVAIVFYRSPDCVPKRFDLRGTFFDFRLLDPPEGCEILMEGFMVWDGVSFAPNQEILHNVKGVPVPIWFVNLWELWEAIDKNGDWIPDSPLTIRDLEKMASLQKGLADFYHEDLQPVGGATVPKINVVTSGALEDGTPFFMLYEHTNTPFLTETILRLK